MESGVFEFFRIEFYRIERICRRLFLSIFIFKTSIHSSRRRTVRLLTVCIAGGGGGYMQFFYIFRQSPRFRQTPPPPQKTYSPFPRRQTSLAPRTECPPPLRRQTPPQEGRPSPKKADPPSESRSPPPRQIPPQKADPCGQTGTCENITFPQLCLRAVIAKNSILQSLWIITARIRSMGKVMCFHRCVFTGGVCLFSACINGYMNGGLPPGGSVFLGCLHQGRPSPHR